MNNKYYLIYIDDEKDQVEELQEQIDHPEDGKEIYINFFEPENSLELMIEKLIEIKPDGLIVDYNLNDKKKSFKHNVPYTGTDIIKEFRTIKQNFPCFILTGFDGDAQHFSDDVNLVYEKSVVHSSGGKFLERVLLQVDKYRSMISGYEEEFNLLLNKKQQGTSTLEEEERIIHLDTILETALDNRASIPSTLKEVSNMEKLIELISKADGILKKWEEES